MVQEADRQNPSVKQYAPLFPCFFAHNHEQPNQKLKYPKLKTQFSFVL